MRANASARQPLGLCAGRGTWTHLAGVVLVAPLAPLDIGTDLPLGLLEDCLLDLNHVTWRDTRVLKEWGKERWLEEAQKPRTA